MTKLHATKLIYAPVKEASVDTYMSYELKIKIEVICIGNVCCRLEFPIDQYTQQSNQQVGVYTCTYNSERSYVYIDTCTTTTQELTYNISKRIRSTRCEHNIQIDNQTTARNFL